MSSRNLTRTSIVALLAAAFAMASGGAAAMGAPSKHETMTEKQLEKLAEMDLRTGTSGGSEKADDGMEYVKIGGPVGEVRMPTRDR